jgi:hypothetical protein
LYCDPNNDPITLISINDLSAGAVSKGTYTLNGNNFVFTPTLTSFDFVDIDGKSLKKKILKLNYI